MRLYTWLPKGKEDHIYNQPRRQALHIIAAVTDTHLVTFVVQTMTIKSDDFQALIASAIDELRNKYSDDNRDFVLLYDNAAVHRTKDVS